MKRYFISLLLAFCLASTLCTTASAALDPAENPTLRISLTYGNGLTDAANLENDAASTSEQGYTIGYFDDTDFIAVDSTDANQITVVVEGDGLRLYDTTNGDTLYQTDDDNLAVRPNSELTWHAGYRYYGDFNFYVSDDQVEVINFVELESYLRGVVPNEMGTSWELEALKAQAVCARSLAVTDITKHNSDRYDLCATTNCQVYHLSSSVDTSLTDIAVEETVGEVLYYQGDVVAGYYSSSNGGASESAVNVWGGNAGYLIGKVDPYEDTENINNGVWEVSYTAAEIAARLELAAYENVGTVANVAVTKRTAMDNVNEVTVTYTDGTTQVISRANCRTVFALNSLNYTLSGGTSTTTSTAAYTSINGAAATASSYVVASSTGTTTITDLTTMVVLTANGVVSSVSTTAQSSSGSYTFSGTGWGHQVGMSQYGALAMAKQGFDYIDILEFYFTDITVK